MFDNFNVNLRKNEGFPTCIPCTPIPEYGQSNSPLSIKEIDSSNKECKLTFSKGTSLCLSFSTPMSTRFL